MQFIKNGPDIPERLLQQHEDGRVVFFCGAGVSYPAGLPGFEGLVNNIYDGIGEAASSIEKAAIKKGQYDTAIGLLEGRIVGGRATVRQQIAQILTPNLSAPEATATHEALLTLARNRDGRYRLITTNFDRIFEEVIARRKLKLDLCQAPFLPVPKHRWDGIVYLHGLLPEVPNGRDLNRLIISSGDFGLAYLTERWAARFVSELFRNFTICFVGYSINDPVLRYMMDALAADRLLGESPAEVFAFGSYPKARENQVADEWNSKNVTPILYREYHHHIYLHRTIRAWAETYRDGALGKERIIVQYAMTKPMASTKQDDFVGRLLWALSDQKGLPAKRFAELDPAPSLDWLYPFSENRFRHSDLSRFGVQPNITEDNSLAFALVVRPTPYTRAPWMSMVARNIGPSRNWDDVMFHLARWLSRHINDPKLILWIAKYGGALHPQFSSLIFESLHKNAPTVPMQTLWRMALSGRLQKPATRFDFLDWRRSFHQYGLTPTLRLRLRALLTPHVLLREPFYSKNAADLEKAQLLGIKDLVDWEIVLGTEHVHLTLKEIAKEEKWNEALPELLHDATSLLRDALDLMRELGGADDKGDNSYWRQPSISKHTQNRDFRDWTSLIDLARDAWVATAEKLPALAQLEVEYWLTIRYPLFRRLAFFAAANSTLIPPRQALIWLLDHDHWWLWSIETTREAIRLLVTIGPHLDSEDRDTLEEAILQGPPRGMFRDDIEPELLKRTMDREIWLRLAKCKSVGTHLSANAANKLETLSNEYPNWRLAIDQSDEFPVWVGGGEDWRIFLPTPKSYRNLLKWVRDHPKTETMQDDDWRERCKRDFRRTACALINLSREGEWVTQRWREALQAWSDENLAARSWRYVSRLLANSPKEAFEDLADSISWWMESIARTFSNNEEAFFQIIERVMTVYRDAPLQVEDDPVSHAINHPIGLVTKAALRWWYRQSLEDGQGLTDRLKTIFTDLCNSNYAIFRHGRLLLATHVITIFRVDSEWAKKNLFPLFDWQLSVFEARSAWEGFLWSPRLYAPLFKEIKPYFLETAQHYKELGKHGDQYAALLTFAGIEPGDTFSKAELSAATRTLPVDGLERVAQALVQALESAGEQRSEYWKNRILPYFRVIWPKSPSLTKILSDALAKLCIAAQDAFPEALKELRDWLKPSDEPDYLVQLLHTAKLCGRFPEDVLTFLDAIVGYAQWPPEDLKDCLDSLEAAKPNLKSDDRLKKLREYLRGHGIQ